SARGGGGNVGSSQVGRDALGSWAVSDRMGRCNGSGMGRSCTGPPACSPGEPLPRYLVTPLLHNARKRSHRESMVIVENRRSQLHAPGRHQFFSEPVCRSLFFVTLARSPLWEGAGTSSQPREPGLILHH